MVMEKSEEKAKARDKVVGFVLSGKYLYFRISY